MTSKSKTEKTRGLTLGRHNRAASSMQAGDAEDMGELFRAKRRSDIERRRAALEKNTADLRERGIFFTSHNGGLHLIVMDRWNFYPSTERFDERRGRPGLGKRRGRGLAKLLAYLEEDAGGKPV